MKWVGVLAGVPDVVVLGLDGRCWLIEVQGARRLSLARAVCDP